MKKILTVALATTTLSLTSCGEVKESDIYSEFETLTDGIDYTEYSKDGFVTIGTNVREGYNLTCKDDNINYGEIKDGKLYPVTYYYQSPMPEDYVVDVEAKIYCDVGDYTGWSFPLSMSFLTTEVSKTQNDFITDFNTNLITPVSSTFNSGTSNYSLQFKLDLEFLNGTNAAELILANSVIESSVGSVKLSEYSDITEDTIFTIESTSETLDGMFYYDFNFYNTLNPDYVVNFNLPATTEFEGQTDVSVLINHEVSFENL